MDERPNLLLILCDQWRGDCISAAGHPVVETPFLDQLAHEGMMFTSAYSPSPICIPARACLATGQTPNGCGRLGYQEKVPWTYKDTLMSCLQRSGYQTFLSGNNHFYPQRVSLGFEEMRHTDTANHDGDYASDYHMFLERLGGGLVKDTGEIMHNNSIHAHPWTHEEGLHITNWTVDSAIELISRRDPTRPWFLQLGLHRPHPPFDPPLAYFNRFEGIELPDVPVGQWASEFDHPVRSIDASRGRLSAVQLDRTRKAYYAQLAHLDFQIGRLIHWLRKRKQLKNTWIVFTSDHGEMLGDHHLFRKSIPLEGSAGIPLIVQPASSYKGLRGAHCDKPVTLYDIMPTLLEAAGVTIPGSVEGASLLSLMSGGGESPWREYLHGECAGDDAGWQYVTDGKEKYFWDSLTGREWFFDLERDPQELRNAVDDAAYTHRVEMWRSRLVDILAERPNDGLSDGKRLIPGNIVPKVRPELLT